MITQLLPCVWAPFSITRAPSCLQCSKSDFSSSAVPLRGSVSAGSGWPGSCCWDSQ